MATPPGKSGNQGDPLEDNSAGNEENSNNTSASNSQICAYSVPVPNISRSSTSTLPSILRNPLAPIKTSHPNGQTSDSLKDQSGPAKRKLSQIPPQQSRAAWQTTIANTPLPAPTA